MPVLDGTDLGTRFLALVGGSVRSAAADAKRAGYRLIAIDRFGDQDLLELSDHWIFYDDQNQWIERLRKLPLAPLVPVGGFQSPETVRFNADSAYLLGDRLIAYPNPSILQSLNCPVRLANAAQQCGITFPQTRSIDFTLGAQPASRSFDDPSYDPCPDLWGGKSWLLKPIQHSGGAGIRFADHLRPGDEATHYLQERLSGVPLGVNYIAWRDAGGLKVKLLGAFRGLNFRHDEHPFLYGGSLGPVRLLPSTLERMSRIGHTIAREFSLVGVFNVDLIMRPNESLALLEVNPRYSASMELLHGSNGNHIALDRTSLIDWHLAAHQGDTRLGAEVERWLVGNLQETTMSYGCKRVVYCGNWEPHIVWKRLERGSDLARKDSRTHLELKICDLPCNESSIVPGGPLCTVLVRNAKSPHEALRASKWLARQIENA